MSHFSSHAVFEDEGGVSLLIVDPQMDFHSGGSLAVPGADEDTKRVTAMLGVHGKSIRRIVVTMDTHHVMHIAHAAFWESGDKGRPPAFYTMTADDVRRGTWRPKQAAHREWAQEYVTALEKAGAPLTIWPEHCLIGTPGHAVVPGLREALHRWETEEARSVVWLFKGMNNLTEMYSCFRAEVPDPKDSTTSMNTELVRLLSRQSKVIFCGQAKSHCVNSSVRDLLAEWPSHRANSDIVILTDATSAVPGFEKVAEKFEADMTKAGLTLSTTSELGKILLPHASSTNNAPSSHNNNNNKNKNKKNNTSYSAGETKKRPHDHHLDNHHHHHQQHQQQRTA